MISRNNKGFTLVELSIVLVIIGLLIGGILVAQSMVSTAKVQATIRQISQYDVAVTNFQTKYKQLPGDSNLFTPAGNNDGQIFCCGGGEPFNVWTHLSQGVGLKNSLGTDYLAYTGATSEAYCPHLKMAQSGSTQCLFVHAGYYVYSDAGGGYSLTPADSLALDQKMDDGIYNTGKVLYWSGNNCISATTNNYDTTINDYVCAINIALGINGNL